MASYLQAWCFTSPWPFCVYVCVCGLAFSQHGSLRVITLITWRLASKRKKAKSAEPVKGILRTVTEHFSLTLLVKAITESSQIQIDGGVYYVVEKHVGCKISLQPSFENTVYHINYYKPLRKTCNLRKMKKNK